MILVGVGNGLFFHLFLLSTTIVHLCSTFKIFKDLYVFNPSYHISFKNVCMLYISVLNLRC